MASDIARMMVVRYPPEGCISDDRRGRDRLRAFIDHKLLAGSSTAELFGIVARLAPWMNEAEQGFLVQRCADQRQGWSPFELGLVFDLTAEERVRLAVWQMWPAGFTEEDAARHRRESRARYARQARRECAANERAKSRAVHDDLDLGDDVKAVYGLTTPAWTPSSKIKEELSTWPAYRHREDGAVMRQIISRSLRKLEALGLVERTTGEGSRQQKIIFVRRTQTASRTGSPRTDVTVTTVTEPKPTTAVH